MIRLTAYNNNNIIFHVTYIYRIHIESRVIIADKNGLLNKYNIQRLYRNITYLPNQHSPPVHRSSHDVLASGFRRQSRTTPEQSRPTSR